MLNRIKATSSSMSFKCSSHLKVSEFATYVARLMLLDLIIYTMVTLETPKFTT
jgi:hypothetical protein